MGDERHLRLFRNGRSKAVRIPKDFEFPGDDVIMRKEGDKLTIEPAPKKSLEAFLELLDTWDPLPEDEQLPEIEDMPPEPFDLDDLRLSGCSTPMPYRTSSTMAGAG